MLKNIKIAHKLPIAFILLTTLTAFLIGVTALNVMRSTIEELVVRKQVAASQIMASEIERRLTTYRDSTVVFGNDYGVVTSTMAFSDAFEAFAQARVNPNAKINQLYGAGSGLPLDRKSELTNAGDGSPYSSVHANWHPWFDTLVDSQQFYDVFLVNKTGDLIYSWAKESDYASNLLDGPHRDTDLGLVVQQAIAHGDELQRTASGRIILTNADVSESKYRPYAVSNGALASFMAVPVMSPTGTFEGVFAIQLLAAPIEAALTRDQGLKVKTHITVLGDGGEPVFYHNIAENAPERTASYWASSDMTPKVLSGDRGAHFHLNQNGEKHIATYTPVNTDGQTYGIVMETAYNEIMVDAFSLRNQIILISIAATLCVAAIGIVFSRSITTPLSSMGKKFAQIVKERDLTVRMDANRADEIGRNEKTMNKMLDMLEATLGEITAGSHEVTDVANSLASASNTMAHNSQITSAAVDEVSSSVEETAAQVRSNAHAAATANKLTHNATAIVTRGKQKVTEMVSAMENISGSSKNIEKIIKVIDEIAFQTNLLALNAAVEAARAGQHGRGFAVVATEVQNLASRASKAARETSDLIDGASKHVTAGVEISTQTSKTFDKVAQDITRVTKYMNDIALASDEQTRAVDQINTAVTNISSTTRQNSQKTEDLATTASELAAVNDNLRAQLKRFKIDNQMASFDTSFATPAPQEAPYEEDRSPSFIERASDVIARNVRKKPNGNGTEAINNSKHSDLDSRGFDNF